MSTPIKSPVSSAKPTGQTDGARQVRVIIEKGSSVEVREMSAEDAIKLYSELQDQAKLLDHRTLWKRPLKVGSVFHEAPGQAVQLTPRGVQVPSTRFERFLARFNGVLMASVLKMAKARKAAKKGAR